MSVAKVFSGQNELLSASIIEVETDLSRGLFAFSVVGLPDKAVEEAKDRVNSALKNSSLESPKSKNHKVVISLAPADIKKEGSHFDLPIAVSYLIASEQLEGNFDDTIFLGELSLNGNLRKVSGVLPVVKKAKEVGFKKVFIPKDNLKEALLIKHIEIIPVETLSEVLQILQGKINPKTFTENEEKSKKEVEIEIDFKDIKGHENIKRALTIAASGGHNVLMWGPPGTGKTMLAKALIGILPELSYEDTLEATSIHSAGGLLKEEVISQPPFRAPHHTSSYVAVVGGGIQMRPGEITLAHKGVLFLDEFPEFDRRVIESLREPLEEKSIRISRARGSALFPADFMLITAMNPCPCGNFGSQKKCDCSALAISRYQKKLSGPILDRIDIHIEVGEVDLDSLSQKKESTDSKTVKKMVEKARKTQKKRFEKHNLPYNLNKEIKPKHLEEGIKITKKAETLLIEAGKKLQISPRSFHRIMRLARTIADLEESEKVEEKHILEALQYRQKREM